LAEILKYPQGIKILMKYHIPCFGCPLMSFEMNMLRVREVSKMYKIDAKKLLKELNEQIKK